VDLCSIITAKYCCPGPCRETSGSSAIQFPRDSVPPDMDNVSHQQRFSRTAVLFSPRRAEPYVVCPTLSGQEVLNSVISRVVNSASDSIGLSGGEPRARFPGHVVSQPIKRSFSSVIELDEFPVASMINSLRSGITPTRSYIVAARLWWR